MKTKPSTARVMTALTLLGSIGLGACAPGVAESMMVTSALDPFVNPKDRGGTEVLYQKELQFARKLDVYRTADRDSFDGSVAFYDGGKYQIPFGKYFLTRYALELRDTKITRLTLKSVSLT